MNKESIWTDEVRAEWERLYEVLNDGDRDYIVAMAIRDKLALLAEVERLRKIEEAAREHRTIALFDPTSLDRFSAGRRLDKALEAK